jgi:hypothetical protein
MFAGEHSSGAPEAVRDFVEDKECTMAIASGANAFPVIGRWNKRSGANRFSDYGGDVTFLREDVFNIIGAIQVAGVTAFERAMLRIRRWHMFTAGEQGTDVVAEDRFASD